MERARENEPKFGFLLLVVVVVVVEQHEERSEGRGFAKQLLLCWMEPQSECAAYFSEFVSALCVC